MGIKSEVKEEGREEYHGHARCVASPGYPAMLRNYAGLGNGIFGWIKLSSCLNSQSVFTLGAD